MRPALETFAITDKQLAQHTRQLLVTNAFVLCDNHRYRHAPIVTSVDLSQEKHHVLQVILKALGRQTLSSVLISQLAFPADALFRFEKKPVRFQKRE